MRLPVDERDLNAQVADLRLQYPRLKDHELFLAWFLHAIVTENTTEAVSALTGNSKDKGADAVYIDDHARVAFVVQSKYHKKLNGGTEKRADVLSFAQLARDLHGGDEDFRALRKEMDARVHEKLGYVRDCLKKRGYRLKLYYVTTARCSKPLIEEAEHQCRYADGPATIDLFDGNRVMLALTDYLDGVAPPVPTMDLPLEVGNGVSSDCLRRHDSKNNITAWIFSMNAQCVADMYSKAGIRLFARNVRGFLGDKKQVNKGMSETIEEEPWNFWYYNNGITIICDRAERISVGGKDVMRVSSPQVINGQQTTRTVHSAIKGNSPASVLIRVVEVPRSGRDGAERFDSLVSRIVAATNWQNAIFASDLMANDRRQVELERELRKFNYCYLRKRQSKSETRRFIGQHQRVITKEEIAQAVAACELDPLIVREGKESLFEEQYYPKIFPTNDPLFYLTRYRLMKEVRDASRGYPERAYAKWLVMHYVWSRLAPVVRARSMAILFVNACEGNLLPLRPLWYANQAAFRAALAFYRKSRGQGERAIDVSTFFKHKGRVEEYESYLRRDGKSLRRVFDQRFEQFESILREMDRQTPKA